MSIEGYDKTKFKEQLNQYLFASGPVRDFSHLFGRSKEMALIEEALSAEGRHVFIYGDRGVGKTSLAAAAANLYQSSDNSHIQIGCGPDTKFYKTIEDLVDRIIKRASGKRNYDVANTFSVKFYKVQWKNKTIDVSIPAVDSMYTAVEAVEAVAPYHSETPIIVIDEFDQIDSEEERRLFSNYLKDLGDRGVNIKLIFTGVAQSLAKLLGDHKSSFRQLHTIELERLYWTPREEIVKEAVDSFGLTIDREIVHSIANISNGFPYYVHLLTEKLLWCAFEAEENTKHIDKNIFKLVKKDDYGGILENPIDRKGVYSYRENILRGFVAMRALEEGVELQGDIPDAPKQPTAFGRDKKRLYASKDYTPRIKFRGEEEEEVK